MSNCVLASSQSRTRTVISSAFRRILERDPPRIRVCDQAVRLLRYEGRDAAWFPCAAGGDAHAGRTETSLMLALDPARVDLELAEPGCTEDIAALMPRLRREGVRAVSPNGILGDPAGASAAEGRELLDRATAELREFVASWLGAEVTA